MRFLLLSCVLVACTTDPLTLSDDTDPRGDTDTLVDTDREDTDVVDTDVLPTDTDVAASAGACDNTDDLAALTAAASTIAATTQSCVFSCIGGGLGACVATCMGEDVGISDPCATCFGKISQCVVNQCLGQCVDASSAACESCRVQNCEPAFLRCAGIQPP